MEVAPFDLVAIFPCLDGSFGEGKMVGLVQILQAVFFGLGTATFLTSSAGVVVRVMFLMLHDCSCNHACNMTNLPLKHAEKHYSV